jgi:hypothetical protein
MDKEQLHNALEQLHKELQQIDSVDEDEKQILHNLMSDIKNLIRAEQSNQVTSYDQLGEGLRQGIRQLEASHPRATLLMGQIADALAKLGI